MSSGQYRFFGPFRLAPANAQLWQGDKEISLRRKTFDVLLYLVDHSGQLVTKQALLDAVWPKVAVSDSMPAVCVKELRKALGDGVRTPRFIETVHGRGYRFVATVTTYAPAEPAPRPALKRPKSVMVGRESELAQLRSWYSRVLEGQRRIIFVSGEAGIGKSTFVEAFLDRTAQAGAVRLARGQCTEQYGAGEPYMPVLEALSRLAREQDGQHLIETLSRFAPTWLAQMPELLRQEERAMLMNEGQSIVQQRMLREMAQALEAITADSPLVLVLEDLHWSDFSTLTLISAIARRTAPAQLMIVGTYRPVEILAPDHPLRSLKQELELHRYCEELRLPLLSEDEIDEYLANRLALDRSRRLGLLAPLIHAQTDGNPLFMVNIVDYLLFDSKPRTGSLEVRESELAEVLRAHHLDALRSIRQLIERNLELLRPHDQAVLESASVAGAEFSAASVAAALNRPQGDVEACCAQLSRREQFVSALGPIAWPDGTVAAGFRFHHALYREVLYGRLPAGVRAELHRRIAAREETGYGERVEEVATELAYHYSRAHDRSKAIQYFRMAGQRATMRGAMIEAEHHFADALAHLSQLPESRERNHRELELQVALGSTLIVVKGWAASETEQAYARARELCERLGDSPEYFPVLFGMYATYLVRGQVNRAHALAEQLTWRAENPEDAALQLYARIARGVTFYFMGRFESALEHFEAALAAYDSERHRPLMLRFGFDAGVWSLCYAAATNWKLGFADQALRQSEQALVLARNLSHPLNFAQAELWTGIVRQFRGEARLVAETTDSLIRRSGEHGIIDWLDWAGCLRGWATAMQGRHEKGIAQLLRCQTSLEARGAAVWRPYFLFLLAEAYLHANLIDRGLRALDDALAIVDKYEEREHEAELHLLKGELLLKRREHGIDAAHECFKRAIAVARGQRAKLVELTATAALARSLARQGSRAEARAMLAEIYCWFTQGFDSAALRAAKLLLDELNGESGTVNRFRT